MMKYARDLNLPPEIVTETIAFLGRRGSGKTYGAKKLTELIVESGGQVVVIDPIGVWWGLRHGRRAKDKGLPVVILGGEHGDLPLTAESGRLIADTVVDTDRSFVLDLSELRKGKSRFFVREFAEQLYHRNRRALHVVVDEADAFAPQSTAGGEKGDIARTLGAMEDLVRRGRARGIGVSLITQRPAVLNKNVLTQAEVMFAFQLTAPQDRKALYEWVRHHGDEERGQDFLDTLPSLGNGESFIWSPVRMDVFQRTKALLISTFDSSATPKAGETITAPGRGADVDLDALKTKMDSLVVEQEANDPKKLKATIADLERKLKSAENAEPAIDPAIVDENNRLRKAVAERDDAIELAKSQVKEIRSQIEQGWRSMCDGIDAIEEHIEQLDVDALFNHGMTTKVDLAPINRSARSKRILVKPPAKARHADIDRSTQDGGLSGPQSKIIASLAWWLSIGVTLPTRQQAAYIAGYSPKSSSFQKALSQLSGLGLIRYPDGGTVEALDCEELTSARPTTTPTLQAFHDAIVEKMSGPQRSIFTTMLEWGTERVERSTVAAEAGYSPKSSSFQKAVSQLSSLGLVEYPDSGSVRLTDLVFPEGLK